MFLYPLIRSYRKLCTLSKWDFGTRVDAKALRAMGVLGVRVTTDVAEEARVTSPDMERSTMIVLFFNSQAIYTSFLFCFRDPWKSTQTAMLPITV